MTGHTGNSEFCFTKTLNIEVKGNQNSLFALGLVILVFCLTSKLKTEKKLETNTLLDTICLKSTMISRRFT